MNNSNEDKRIKKMLDKSRLKMPFSNFEHDVMMQIEIEESLRNASRSGVVWSSVFFIAGLIFGILLTMVIPQIDISFLGLGAGDLNLLFQVGFCLFILLHLEKLIDLTKSGRYGGSLQEIILQRKTRF